MDAIETLDALSAEDVIEPLTMVGDQVRDFLRRANLVLRLPAK